MRSRVKHCRHLNAVIEVEHHEQFGLHREESEILDHSGAMFRQNVQAEQPGERIDAILDHQAVTVAGACFRAIMAMGPPPSGP
jgi:hypothetical protein